MSRHVAFKLHHYLAKPTQQRKTFSFFTLLLALEQTLARQNTESRAVGDVVLMLAQPKNRFRPARFVISYGGNDGGGGDEDDGCVQMAQKKRTIANDYQ